MTTNLVSILTAFTPYLLNSCEMYSLLRNQETFKLCCLDLQHKIDLKQT